MSYFVFAAIDVGSDEVSMKIYQIGASIGIKQLDYVSQYLALGTDTYRKGVISNGLVDELCNILVRFCEKMKEYKVSDYRAYGSSALREAANREMILDQIFLRTGIQVKIASNSEQHYLMYKGIASRSVDFNKVIQKNTAIIDMGAGSVQVSVFDKEALALTQNLRIGAVRMNELLAKHEDRVIGFHDMLIEYIYNEVDTFYNFHMKERSVKNIIAVGNEIEAMKKIVPELSIKDSISSEQMEAIYERIITSKPQKLANKYGLPIEAADVLLPAAIIYKIFLERSKAEMIWIPQIDLCDSIVADYADSKGKVLLNHDFEQDIITMAKNISKRYQCNKTHIKDVAEIALSIFDRIRKIHGLSGRERLLLHIAVILHDCGKYINMNAGGNEAYNIIMGTEIVGLSHKERELVANIVKYNTNLLPSYKEFSRKADLSQEEYIIVSKLTAILRVANALDRSHKQKIDKISVSLKDGILYLKTDTIADISLEKVLFSAKADFFEQVYGIRPVIKQRRIV